MAIHKRFTRALKNSLPLDSNRTLIWHCLICGSIKNRSMMIKKHGQGFLESLVPNNINWWYSYTGWMMDVWGKWTYGTIAFLICVSRYVIWDPAHTGVWEKKRTQGAHQQTLRATIQKFNLINQYHTLFFFIFNQQLPPPLQDTGVFEKKDSGGSPTHQARIETSEQAAERWGSSRPFQAQCAVDARDVNTCWAQTERDKTFLIWIVEDS